MRASPHAARFYVGASSAVGVAFISPLPGGTSGQLTVTARSANESRKPTCVGDRTGQRAAGNSRAHISRPRIASRFAPQKQPFMEVSAVGQDQPGANANQRHRDLCHRRHVIESQACRPFEAPPDAQFRRHLSRVVNARECRRHANGGRTRNGAIQTIYAAARKVEQRACCRR